MPAQGPIPSVRRRDGSSGLGSRVAVPSELHQYTWNPSKPRAVIASIEHHEATSNSSSLPAHGRYISAATSIRLPNSVSCSLLGYTSVPLKSRRGRHYIPFNMYQGGRDSAPIVPERLPPLIVGFATSATMCRFPTFRFPYPGLYLRLRPQHRACGQSDCRPSSASWWQKRPRPWQTGHSARVSCFSQFLHLGQTPEGGDLPLHQPALLTVQVAAAAAVVFELFDGVFAAADRLAGRVRGAR